MVGVGSRFEAWSVLNGVAQLSTVARYLVAEELFGQRPVVGVTAEALEVPVGDGARARVHNDATVHCVDESWVGNLKALRVSVKLHKQLQIRSSENHELKNITGRARLIRTRLIRSST